MLVVRSEQHLNRSRREFLQFSDSWSVSFVSIQLCECSSKMASIKKMVVFGSTGNTGLCCLEAALELGYEVTAFVRDPSKLPEELASKVTPKVGDVLNASQVDEAVQGQDAVVIALGTRNDLSPTTMMSEGTKNILSAMNSHGVQRVSACMSAFNFWERSKVPERFLEILADHERMIELLKSSSVEWIAVLPPHITDEPGTKDYTVEHGKGPGRMISKYDLGHFLVTCLSKDDHIHQMCGLCNKTVS